MWKCGLSTDTGCLGQSKFAGIVRGEANTEHENRIRTDRTTSVCLKSNP